jgi:hypothetical protein
MAKITEKDIINHLQEKIKFHQQESKRIEKILAAFALSSDFQDVSNFNFGGNMPESDKERKFKPGAEVRTLKKLEPPLEYNSNLTIVNKIAYALNKIGEGYNEDIANIIAQGEPSSDVKKISQLISGVLSTLKTNGLVTARKEGRKHKFSLVK